jgi:hypothetical protein
MVLVDGLRKQAYLTTFGAWHLGNLPANKASEQRVILYLEPRFLAEECEKLYSSINNYGAISP